MNEITPIEILQSLIRFDTTNPPGKEEEAITWIKNLFAKSGIESHTYEKFPKRPNLVARLKGEGNAPPLLLQGHVDVVTTKNQDWEHPPFSGEIVDDYLWGRGALDMKGGVAMMIAAFLKAKNSNLKLPGDVLITILADEENGSTAGADFLVNEHPELFQNVRYALGEFGGFSMNIAGKRFYPIMIAEKQICWMKLTFHGSAGHGSLVHHGGAMAKLGQSLTALDKGKLPVHITSAAKLMMQGMAKELSFPLKQIIHLMLNPALTDAILNILGKNNELFYPLLHNTINPTIVNGGDKINVIPSEISLNLDGRLLPGLSASDMVSELKGLIGDDVEIEVFKAEPGPSDPDMHLFPVLVDILKEADPSGHPIPLFLSAVTDARHFSRLGIQTYGFTPMTLPEDFNFSNLIHAANERIPVKAVEFGTNAITQALQRFGEV
ncbi:MAG: M20/M25/M40 family metallo-hydrolase [Anaerolineales bacterium]|nr:M20/M25/M40 family metallo-hydrolase [Anaerolineales bacterium]